MEISNEDRGLIERAGRMEGVANSHRAAIARAVLALLDAGGIEPGAGGDDARLKKIEAALSNLEVPDTEELNREMADKDAKIEALEARLARLEAELGGAPAAKVAASKGK